MPDVLIDILSALIFPAMVGAMCAPGVYLLYLCACEIEKIAEGHESPEITMNGPRTAPRPARRRLSARHLKGCF